MRMLALAGFFGLLYLVGYFRGRPVTYSEQFAWVMGVFLACLLARTLGII